MTTSPVVAHFDGVADTYDQVLPFFASFAARVAQALSLPAVESHRMDAAALGFPDATFDLVVAGFVLHIMSDPVTAVAEVKRVLRPGGQFAFTIPGGRLLDQAGFTDVSWQTLEVAIPVPDGETYWRFARSHGTGARINALPDDKRTELHDRFVAAVDADGDFTLRRSATLALARRP